MLIPCPECALNVSDKAISCPHCGFPLKPEKLSKKTKGKYNKRRRLPNGFGQISEIKNRKLRNPFRAMITVGNPRSLSSSISTNRNHIFLLITPHTRH